MDNKSTVQSSPMGTGPIVKKYLVDEVLNSLYYELYDEDGNFDGQLRLVCTINGRVKKISLSEIFNSTKPCRNNPDIDEEPDCEELNANEQTEKKLI